MNTIRHDHHDMAAAVIHHTLLTIDVQALAPALAHLPSLETLLHAGASPEDKGPPSLCTLAMELEQYAIILDHQLAKERAVAEWQTKKRASRPQAPPCGLFEQRQEELWNAPSATKR